jgi:hypothetical protein
VTFALPETAWTIRKGANAWELLDGEAEGPTVWLRLGLEDAALLFSRGLRTAQIPERVVVEGDQGLGSVLVAGLGAFFGSA